MTTTRGRDADAAVAELSEHMPAALRLAAVLTGGGDAAARLVADALEGHHRAVAKDDYPELALRRLVAQRYGHDRRSRRSTAAGRDGAAGVESRADDVAARFAALPPMAQVALALRLVEHVTTAEIATTIERPPSQVAKLLEQAHDRLQPASEDDIAGTLRRRAATAPDPETLRGAGQARPHDRRRLRAVAIGVAAVVVVGLAVVAPTVIAPRLPVAARPTGHWGTVVTTARASGWQVSARTIVANQEVALVTHGAPTGAADDGTDKNACTVLVADGSRLSDYPDRRGAVSVNGHRGYLLGSQAAPEARIAWAYARTGAGEAVAEIDCSQLAGATDSDVVAAAAKIRFKAGTLDLPYQLDRAPEHFSPGWVATGSDGSVDATYTSIEARWSFVTVTISMDHSTASIREAQTTRTTINGRTAYVSQDRDDTGLPQICLMDDRGRVCVKAYWTAGDWTTRYQMNDDIGAVMMATAEQLHLASNLDDPSTWFDAEDVLR